MQWYKHYLTDYGQDTVGLNFLQDAAYRRLLDAYYQREGPIPNDLKLIYRMVHAHSRHEQDAVKMVLKRYFKEESRNGSGNSDSHLEQFQEHEFASVRMVFTNHRADKEIEQYQAQCSANRRPNRQRIVNESGSESPPRIDRVDRIEPPLPPNVNTCRHRLDSGQFCNAPGTHKLHPRSTDWFCREHQDG